jgi:hypothetical protein
MQAAFSNRTTSPVILAEAQGIAEEYLGLDQPIQSVLVVVGQGDEHLLVMATADEEHFPAPTLKELWKYRSGQTFEMSKTVLPENVAAVFIVADNGASIAVNERLEEESYFKVLQSLKTS